MPIVATYDSLQAHSPWAITLAALFLLGLTAWLTHVVVKRLLPRGIHRILKAVHSVKLQDAMRYGIVSRLAETGPALVIMTGAPLVPNLPESAVRVMQNVASAVIVLSVALAISAVLNLINDIYHRRPQAKNRPIKGYVQVVKIALFAVTGILIIATLIDRSPLILLSGLGAMAAVLMLIFQDTLLSLVASVQMSSSDMVRVGDWIEMPQLNADGDVIDIALHTVKVQNWDKTITTLPTRRLITEPFKNWRGMQESGGRRIKRALYLDQNSIRFLHPEERQALRRFTLLEAYLDRKEAEITEWNNQLGDKAKQTVNTRRITNIGSFRAYVEQYLRHHTGIHQGMTLLVRQLAPTSEGLPLEVYCFTSTTAWAAYEGIQSDIFDHLFAILPEFGLHVFQAPTGADFRHLPRVDTPPAKPRRAT